jgi:ribosomal-protein-alanine N-acetyltransferase
MSYEILPMTAEHVPAVAALEAACFSDPWSERSIAGELDNPLSRWLVAVEDGTVLGYVGSQTVLDEADVMNVAVSPDARRRGVAKALMIALLDVLRQNQVKTLTLEVRASNDPAIALYDTLGFTQAGRRPRYYRHPVEDALILRVEV